MGVKKVLAFVVTIFLIVFNAGFIIVNTGKVNSKNESFTLRIVGSSNMDEGIDVATKLYQKIYPKAKVDFITSSWGAGGRDTKEKELMMVNSGEDIDIGKMAWSKEFFRAGILADLTNSIKTWDIYKHLSKSQLERMTIDGKLTGITFGNNCIYMFYNKDILARIGVKNPPKTIAELTRIAKILKAKNLKAANGGNIYATSFEGGNWATDYWLWANGGKQMNASYTRTLIDSPESIKAFTVMQDFVKNGYAPKIDGSYDKLWLNGQITFWPCGDWDITATNDMKIKVGYAVMPVGPGGNTVSIGGIEEGVFKNSKHKQEAIDFLKVLVSREFQLSFDRGVTDLTLYSDPVRVAGWKSNGTLASKMVEKQQMANTKYNFLENPFVFPDASKIYENALERILVNMENVRNVMKEAAAEINGGIAAK
jgi:ABC-type glycerol-3-phosphate transport system substrate-binding protein